MKEPLKKQDMVVGKEYKGYAWVNDFMEIHFRPAAVGSRAGRVKKICEEQDFALSETKNFVQVYIRLPKQEGGATAYIKALTGAVNKLIAAFMKYEI